MTKEVFYLDHKCEECEFVARTKKGLNIHEGRMHKREILRFSSPSNVSMESLDGQDSESREDKPEESEEEEPEEEEEESGDSKTHRHITGRLLEMYDRAMRKLKEEEEEKEEE